MFKNNNSTCFGGISVELKAFTDIVDTPPPTSNLPKTNIATFSTTTAIWDRNRDRLLMFNSCLFVFHNTATLAGTFFLRTRLPTPNTPHHPRFNLRLPVFRIYFVRVGKVFCCRADQNF